MWSALSWERKLRYIKINLLLLLLLLLLSSIAADQPIYAVAKQMRWHWPDHYGEEKIVMIFGGLHVEMALKSFGIVLWDSHWTMAEARIASTGKTESFLTASSITRTRQIHHITACCLHKLMKTAYSDYCTETELCQLWWGAQLWRLVWQSQTTKSPISIMVPGR